MLDKYKPNQAKGISKIEANDAVFIYAAFNQSSNDVSITQEHLTWWE